ncbi:hypothetical protein HPB47_008701, partial [Ixodes persulcatus]
RSDKHLEETSAVCELHFEPSFILRDYVHIIGGKEWRVAGFEGAESTTRIVRIVLREGVTLERLPHQLRFGSGTVLVVVPGRAPICLRCRKTGHIRRDCRAPRCSECRAYGHEQQDCVRSYARAAVRGAGDEQNDLLMDEEEAERAAAPTATSTEQPTPVDKDGRPDTGPKEAGVKGAKQLETAASAPAVEDLPTSLAPEGDARDVAATDSEPAVSEMDLDKIAVKRRHEGGAEFISGTAATTPRTEVEGGAGVEGQRRSAAVFVTAFPRETVTIGHHCARGLPCMKTRQNEHLLKSSDVRNLTKQSGKTVYLHCVVDLVADRMNEYGYLATSDFMDCDTHREVDPTQPAPPYQAFLETPSKSARKLVEKVAPRRMRHRSV